MSETSFQLLHELFDRLSDMPAEERDDEIARSTADSPGLAEELRALLEHSARPDSPLDNAALWLGEGSDPPLPLIPGFRVHRRIGRGGSATVYLADQENTDFTRVVALKVVDRVVDAPSLRRAREEQRILARLEHTGIARLYDTGVTPAGQPYLVMEHVEGESILEHCRSRQLPVRARLELFLSVLDAVVYAHGEAIVHRDLKPANILVSARGETKLLDFGIAKLVAEPGDDGETRTLERAMTPAYASPEQVRGERVTAASDIYSLGVVLYELLAGTVPFANVGDVFREQDLEAPSAAFARTAATTASTTGKDRLEVARWRRALRGDLDAVLLKALREKPEARYASAAALADDLRRVLAGEPVAARRGHRVYRAGKLLHRHRGVVAVLVVALSLVGIQQMWSRWRAGTAGPDSEFAAYEEISKLDAETRRWLREGGEQLTRFDAAGSRDSFRRAVASSGGTSPGAALAWDGVARAESALGEVGRAAEAARRAGHLIAGHTADLPRDEAERLRARAMAADRDWSAAIPALDSLFGRQPGRVDIGLDLVAALLATGRSDQAGNALGRLRQLSAPRDAGPGAAGDPRIDLQEGEVAQQLSEYQRAAAAAARARERARQLGAAVLGLRAERLHGEAIARLDRREEARRELESVVTRDTAAGLARETAAAQLALGWTLTRMAGNAEARRTLETALAGLVAAGDRRGQIGARLQLAVQTAKRGKVAEGLREADAALADARQIGDRWAEGYVLSQRLVMLNWADDDNAVEVSIAPTLAALRESGNRQPLMATLGNVAIFAIDHLQLDRAEAYLDEAEGLARRVGSQASSGAVDRARGSLEQTRGNLDLAREHYLEAVDKARRAGIALSVGYYEADLAWLELDADRPDAASEYANQAIAALTKAGDTRLAAATEAVLAWADARRGNREAAHRRLAILRKSAAEDDSDSAGFNLLVAEARIAEAEGDWKKAADLRRQLIRKATGWKARGLMIAQQAGLARALHGAGDRAGLETLVAELLPEVDRLGLRGIARDLRALLASPPQKSGAR